MIPDDISYWDMENVEEMGRNDLELLRHMIQHVNIQYLPEFERFKAVITDPIIHHISFSPQLGYILGFSDPNYVEDEEIAKYASDLRGGFTSFAVYLNNLTENMIIGNSLSSLLRVVSIGDAKPGDYVEKIYDSVIWAKVLPKEVQEIEVELRTLHNGELVPFAFGQTLIVLIFKKIINF